MASQAWEELRNSNGALYKLTAKLSAAKEVSITLVPKSKLVYMHVNDNSKAFKNGTFDQAMSKSVSLSMAEAMVLKTLMASMDPKVTELTSTSNQPAVQGRKRKHPGDDLLFSTTADAMLSEFNSYQVQPLQPPYANEVMNNQQYYAVPQYHQVKQQRLQQPMANSQPGYAIPQYQQAPPAYSHASTSGPQSYAGWQQPTMNYDIETPNFYDSVV